MLLVNARLPFISEDFWYGRLPNNTAALTVKTIQRCFLQQLDRLRHYSDLQRQNMTRKRHSFIQYHVNSKTAKRNFDKELLTN